jgi:hypothetical protein
MSNRSPKDGKSGSQKARVKGEEPGIKKPEEENNSAIGIPQ